MAKTGALFSEGDAGRIGRVVRQVEGQAGGEGGKRRRRVPGQAAVLWAKLTSDFNSGAANTVKANLCDADDGNTISDVELVLYVELPMTGTPDRSGFSANDVVGYMPYVFRDAEGNKTADGFLVSVVSAAAGGSGGGVEYGKPVSSFTSDGSIELDPCNVLGSDNGKPNVTVNLCNVWGRTVDEPYSTDDIFAFTRAPVFEEILDNTDGGTVFVGAWTETTEPDNYGSNFRHDQNAGKGTKTATYSSTLPVDGDYEVYMWWPTAVADTNVPVRVTRVGGTDTVYVNQAINGGQWNRIGKYSFYASGSERVQIQTTGTTYYVLADAVKLVLAGSAGVVLGIHQGTVISPQLMLDVGNPANISPSPYGDTWDRASQGDARGVMDAYQRTGLYKPGDGTVQITYFYRVVTDDSAGHKYTKAAEVEIDTLTVPLVEP